MTLASSPPRHARRRAAQKRRWLRRSLIGAVVVVVLLIGVVVGDYYYLGSLVHHKVVKHLQAGGNSENAVNILLIGSTSRCALTVQNPAYGLCSAGVTGVNADIDMIVHLSPATGKVSLLSIPRDLFVPNARIEGANKIDAALYDGPSQLVAAIEEDFGIPINHFVELNFDTFANVVDALGGVRMYFPTGLFDQESGLDIRHSGCYLLHGTQALQVVRARHLQIQPNATDTDYRHWPQESLSDLARIRRTHEFLRVLAKNVAARGIGNPLTDQSIATSVLPDLTVDSGFSESEMVHLARVFANTNISAVAQETYPVVTLATSGYSYKGYNYGDVVFPVDPTGTSLISQLFGVTAAQSVFTGAALPAPGSFPVAVESGNGSSTQAALVGSQLRTRGFKIEAVGTRTPTGPVTETVVWYGGVAPPPNGNWKSPSLLDAERVMSEIEGPAMMGYNPAEVAAGSLVTVQTGTGLTIAPMTHVASLSTPSSSTSTSQPPATTNSSSPGQTTVTTTPDPSGIASNPVFSAPSATNPALEPWDPRGCNATHNGPATSP